jgi:hypothetical protein
MSDAARTAYLNRVHRVAAVITRAGRDFADPIADVAAAMSPLAWSLAFENAGVMYRESMVADVVLALRSVGGGRPSHPDGIPSDKLTPSAGGV